jgi:hypothetical protein
VEANALVWGNRQGAGEVLLPHLADVQVEKFAE